MNNVIIITKKTAIRVKVITDRTRSTEMGIMKAMMIENLKQKLANGIAHFIYKKKDGTIREAWGTLQQELAKAMTNGRGVSREKFGTTAYYDIEAGGWRSFCWENLVHVF